MQAKEAKRISEKRHAALTISRKAAQERRKQQEARDHRNAWLHARISWGIG